MWEEIYEHLRAATAGKFEVGRELGHGGMAAVYLAQEVKLNRRVAIKVMSPTLMLAPGMMERFRQEAVTVAALSHPNIITIYTVDEMDGLQYFVMKYLPGPSLETIISKDAPLPVSVVKTWMTQVASALGYAHRRGVIHRDVKPANILLDDDGNAIVTDFGIAKVALAPSLTQTGVAVGTPAYMSPEQCAAGQVSGATDQYSLGIVAYEMLAGEPPFTGPSLAVMQSHIEDSPRPITVFRPDCPSELQEVIERMLEKDPERRWPSMEEMVSALDSRPLAHDDPIRTQLASFVGSRGTRPPAVSPPLVPAATPIPRDRPRTPPTAAPQAPPRAPARAAVAVLDISPAPSSLGVGDAVQLSATPRDVNGTELTGRRVRWSTSHPRVAAVSSNGGVKALRPGSVTITADCDGASAAATFLVAETPVGSIQVTPPRRPLVLGKSVRLKATPKGPGGETLGHRELTWSTNKPDIAEVLPDGVVTAHAEGYATITVTCEGQTAAVDIETVATGAASPVRRFWWAVPAAAAVAIVLWLALRGQPEVAPVAAVDVSPTSTSIAVGGTVELLATVRDADGTELADRALSWQSSDDAVALVSTAGLVTGMAAGTATITALAEGGVTATAVVAVTLERLPVASVSIDPPSGTVMRGQSLRLTAAPADENGTALGGREVVWESSDAAVATVSQAGVVSGVGLGRATITATSEGQRATASVEVTAAAVARVALDRPSATVPVGDSLQLSATTFDQRGSALRGRQVRWTSSASNVATVSEGLVRAIGEGSVTITASSEGQSASTSITVEPPPVTEISLAVQPGSIVVGDSVRPRVTGPAGSPVPAADLNLTIEDTTVARVSPSGWVIARSAGSTTVYAFIGQAQAAAPLVVTPAVATYGSVSAGSAHTCAIAPSGEVSCWGDNRRGQITSGAPEVRPSPVALGAKGAFSSISSGREHTCGVTRAGGVTCWGNESDGRLGSAMSGPFIAVAAGGSHTCALRTGGTAVCWGRNDVGQLGSRGGNANSPRPVSGGMTFSSLVTGGDHSCGISGTGAAYCWGSNWASETGTGRGRQNIEEPAPVEGGLLFSALAAGEKHTCGLTRDGQAYCWGDNGSGQLGDGSRSERNRPVAVGTSLRFTAIAAGAAHSCALTRDGRAYCWGNNDSGQLGNGTAVRSAEPAAVAGDDRFESISAGASHTCGLTTANEMRCWGGNGRGQVGDGSQTNRPRPVAPTTP